MASNIHYPQAELKQGIQGTVYVNFIVEKDGSLSNMRILKGVANGPALDAEALRVMALMPKWHPGSQNGKPVRVAYNLPIRFLMK
jgi:protein TonB